MLTKIKHGSLVVCLFLFLFVVIGGGLHLNPGGAFLAAVTGTPLVIHLFNRLSLLREVEHDSFPSLLSPGFERSVGEVRASQPPEAETAIRQ